MSKVRWLNTDTEHPDPDTDSASSHRVGIFEEVKPKPKPDPWHRIRVAGVVITLKQGMRTIEHRA